MRNRVCLSLLAAALLALPLAAHAQTGGDATSSLAEPGVEATVVSPVTGTIAEIDSDTLVVETDAGDRVTTTLDSDSLLPAELRQSSDWSTWVGTPVRVTFTAGTDGEPGVVQRVELLPAGTTATTTTTTATTGTATTAGTTTGTTGAATGETDETDAVEASPASDLADSGAATMPETAAPDDTLADDTTATDRVADDELPRTASDLPWLLLIGGLALATAVTLGRFQSTRQTRRASTRAPRV